MKKFLATITTAALAATVALSFTACKGGTDDPYTIVVGASQTPHAEILHVIEDKLASYGYTLEIKVFDDYITPNTALDEGSLDANYFQHTPYLNTFNKDYGTSLVSAGKIHYEPFGVYGKNVSQEEFDTNKTGRTIFIPNDGSNLTRALFVLQDEGYITLKSDVTASDTLTVQDIADNKGNTVRPVEAATVSAQLAEANNGAIAVINGNYALQAGLSVSTDALAVESAAGDAAQLYANIIAVKKGKENHSKTKALLTALYSQEVYAYINATYGGAVLPVFSV